MSNHVEIRRNKKMFEVCLGVETLGSFDNMNDAVQFVNHYSLEFKPDLSLDKQDKHDKSFAGSGGFLNEK